MEVRVLDWTENAEEIVCRAARGDYYPMSYDYNEDEQEIESSQYFVEPIEDFEDVMEGVNGETIEEKKKNLIHELLGDGHYGPFEEHVKASFVIKGASRVTMAQMRTHRHMTFDVQSQRYVNFSDVEPVIPMSLKKDETLKNLKTKHLVRDEGIPDVDNKQYWREKYRQEMKNDIETYEAMIEDGVPKEDARYLLGTGMPICMTVSGNARAWLHILDMRKKANAQTEIAELSEHILEELKVWMPNTFSWYEEKGPMRLSP